MPDLLIVIPVHNGLEHTLECLESLSASDFPLQDILIVDNGSTDGTARIVSERFPAVQVFTQPNLGFAAAANVGIKHAIAHGYAYTWLLNNDTFVSASTPQQLIEFMNRSENQRVGACSPIVYFASAKDAVSTGDINFAGGQLDREHWTSWHILDIKQGEQLLQKQPEDSFLTGCALLIRNEAAQDIGFLDDRFFMYWEDGAFSADLVRKGWQLRMVTEAGVAHKIFGSSGGSTSAFTEYYFTRNRFLMWRKYAQPKQRLGSFLALLNDVTPKISALFTKEFTALDCARAKGVLDGICGRFGQRRISTSPARARQIFQMLCILLLPYRALQRLPWKR